jgi:hypothetical protein
VLRGLIGERHEPGVYFHERGAAMTAEHTSDNLPTPEERLRLVLADAPAGTWAIGVAIDLLIAAADDLGRLRRERAAALESVVWRANWMARATAAISALMDELDPDTEDPLWAELVELEAEEFNDGDEEDDDV